MLGDKLSLCWCPVVEPSLSFTLELTMQSARSQIQGGTSDVAMSTRQAALPGFLQPTKFIRQGLALAQPETKISLTGNDWNLFKGCQTFKSHVGFVGMFM